MTDEEDPRANAQLRPQQIHRLNICNKYIMGLEIALLINDMLLVEDLTVKIVDCVRPILQQKHRTRLLFKPLLQVAESLEKLASKQFMHKMLQQTSTNILYVCCEMCKMYDKTLLPKVTKIFCKVYEKVRRISNGMKN